MEFVGWLGSKEEGLRIPVCIGRRPELLRGCWRRNILRLYVGLGYCWRMLS